MPKPYKNPRFIKPPNRLKMKVGTGSIDERLLDQAQAFIQKSETDFKPIAENLLKDVNDALKKLRGAQGKAEMQSYKEELAGSVMQLKANGGMFRYQLISEIAGLALHFLENVDSVNDEALQVVDVHAKTIHIILANDLKGDGGKEGYALVKELEKACKRFFAKYKP